MHWRDGWCRQTTTGKDCELMISRDDGKPEPDNQMPMPAHLRRLKVSDLLAGGREAILEHEGQDYRLRITSNGKLILTK